jgi:hypothetical protein
MNIEVYSGFSKKPNSTKQPSTPRATLAVRLKEACSVLRPVFLVNQYNLSDNYVKWGSRYHYIEDIVIIGNELAEYHCSTDVLATFKSVIGSSSQYVVRSSSESDGNLVDNLYPLKSKVETARCELPNIRTAFTMNSSGSYVIGVKSGNAGTGLKYIVCSASAFEAFTNVMFGGQWLNATDVSQDLQKMLVDPMQYISSVMWFPYLAVDNAYTTPTFLTFGYWDAHDFDSACVGRIIPEEHRVKEITDQITIPDHPQVSRGSYLNGSPFRRITADIAMFGRLALDPDFYIDSGAATVKVSVDAFTGVGELVITSTKGRVVKIAAQVGIPVQLSQVTRDPMGAVLNTVSGVAAGLTGNYVGAAAGVASAVQSMMPQVQSMGAVGSIVAFNHTPEIRINSYTIADEDNAQLGRPLCKVRTISNIAGFIQCDRADLDISASPSEKDQIISYMNEGFYYE